jgi:cobalt/nickel transport protein
MIEKDRRDKMKPTIKNKEPIESQFKMFDTFTKLMLTVMISLLIVIFASGKYMTSHNMNAEGTDNVVNNMASSVAKVNHHPFINLPGDAQVGAFTVSAFFAGLIVGHYWEKLFGESSKKKDDIDV